MKDGLRESRLYPFRREFRLAQLLFGFCALIVGVTVQAQYSPPSMGLVGWWRAEGDGLDSSPAGNHGTLLAVAFEPGLFGQAFAFVGNTNRVYIPDSSALKLTNSLTIAAWIFARANSWHVLERAGGTGGSWTYSFGLDNAGHLMFQIQNFTNGEVKLSYPIAFNQWKHIAATLDGSNGNMRMYIDGLVVAQTNTAIRPSAEINAPSPGVGIGNSAVIGGWPFIGLVDETVLYSRALSASEIATLAIGPSMAPVITVQPRGQIAYFGSDVTLNVAALGTPPLSYLWFKDGFGISWATNSILTLTNVQSAESGSYYVVISNSIGQATSSNVVVLVNPVGVSAGLYPGLTIQGALGKSYGIQYATNVTATSIWTSLGTVTLTQTVQLWIDTEGNLAGGAHPQRFYRVVLLP